MDRFYEAMGRVEDHFRSRETEIRDGLTEVAAAVNSDLTRSSWADGEYPAYRFKPTGFANGPSDLGGWTP
jgi:hypothetical protein